MVDSIARLPNLESIYLLNPRGDTRTHRSYVFPSLYPLNGGPASLAHAHTHPHTSTPPSRARNGRKKKTADKDDQPDKLYVDALAIAAKNRLHRHGESLLSGPGTSSSAAAAAATARSWTGKLKHIGIRNISLLGIRQPTRVWRVQITEEPVVQPVAAVERRMSLRSSKKRKSDHDWREVREGDRVARLREITNEEDKAAIADGLFKGMDRFED
jgi:hypothetical protein